MTIQLRTEGLPELERCSEAIDPDNAEEVAKEIREKRECTDAFATETIQVDHDAIVSFRKKWRDQWRKRVIRENHEAIQQKKAEIRVSDTIISPMTRANTAYLCPRQRLMLKARRLPT